MKSSKSAALPWLLLPLALFAAGCQQDAAEEAEAASATETAAEPVAEEAAPVEDGKAAMPAEPAGPVPGPDATIIEDHATPTAAAPSFDAKAFEGHYASGNTMLEIAAGGAFVLKLDGNAIDGTWTLQPGGKTATLDPNSKGETDREIEILSNDSVKIVGGATLTRQTGAH
jgi:hypothetical protein